MDISLNGVGEGIEAAREIRDRFDVPVVYLTAHSDSETLEQAKLTEPFGYILKPYQDRELLVAIETALHRHQAEKRLAETKRWLAATLSSIADAVITTGVDTRVSFMNAAAENLTGWKQHEAIGKDLFDVFQFVDAEAARNAQEVIQDVLRDGIASALRDPTILVAKDDKRTLVADSVAPIRGERGAAAGLVLVFRDVSERERAQREIRQRNAELEHEITERKRAEAALESALAKEEEERRLLEAVFSAQADGIFVCDAEGVVLRRNPAGATFFGFDPAGMRLPQFVEKIGLTGGLSASVTHRALRGETILAMEQAAGDRILETSSVPMRDPEGHILGAVTISRDITERKLLEERLRQAHKMESVGLLAGGVAHDFNNLLGVIMGHAGLAIDSCPKCENMACILEATQRAADLTKQLLAYAGKGRFVSEVIDLSDLVSTQPSFFEVLSPRNSALSSRSAEYPTCLEADPSQIRQILMNLVVNASEAMSRETGGLIRVETRCCTVDAELASRQSAIYNCTPGRYVCLEVQDNGRGMDEATKAKIFDPFFSTKFTGRGLGLAGVQGILRTYKGFVQVQSTPGVGTTFTVYLPASEKNVARPTGTHRSGSESAWFRHRPCGRRRRCGSEAGLSYLEELRLCGHRSREWQGSS